MLDPRSVGGIIPTRGEGSRPWDLYRQVPELRSGIQWLAAAISRADLYVARIEPEGPVREDDPEITCVLDELFSTGPSMSDMLKRMILHLECPGETFLAPWVDDRMGRVWSVASAKELRSNGSGQVEYQRDLNVWVPCDGKVGRIWHADPEEGWRADSPVVAMESILHNIISLTARLTAIGQSRAAGNGLLGIADTLSVQSPASEGVNPIHSRDIATSLEDAMVAPMTDRGLASSVVPLLLVGPKEDLKDGIIRVNLASDLDAQLPDQLDQALRRLGISLAIPPDVLTGLGEVNHWSGAVILEEAVQVAVEPRTDTVCAAFTSMFLRPHVEKLGLDPASYAVLADLMDLTVKPDKSQSAMTARQQGLLTDEAWARYSGFEESDVPKGKDRERILLERVMLADPTTAPFILPKLGISVPGLTAAPVQADPEEDLPTAGDVEPALDTVAPPERLPTPGQGGRVLPSPSPSPEIAPPDAAHRTQPLTRAALAASVLTDPEAEDDAANDVEEQVVTAVEACVLAALDRAGARLLRSHSRSHRAGLREVPNAEMHLHLPVTASLKAHMLKGAFAPWEQSMPRLALMADSYVGYLLDNRVRHSRELLKETLYRLSDHWDQQGEAA